MENSKENEKKVSNKRSFMGAIFIAFGVILTIEKMGILPENISDILLSWESLLIGIGLLNIGINKNYQSGLILIAIGTFFSLPKLFDISYETKEMFWPFIFVVVGTLMITVKNRHKSIGNTKPENEIDSLNILGGGKCKVTSENFIGGKITSIFGGSEFDLRSSKIVSDEIYLDTFTIFGGTKIIVPEDWDVQIDVVSIFGGFQDKRNVLNFDGIESPKILKIKGFAIFGGGDVKSS